MMRHFLYVLGSLILIFQTIGTMNAQSDQLPTDLLFAALKNGEMVILRIDAKTLVQSVFYKDSDPNVYSTMPIKWSPDGQKLLISRGLRTPYMTQLCLLTREAILLRCFGEIPHLIRDELTNENQSNLITWSADSRKVYFASVKDSSIRLIEADTETGRTLQVLHTAPITEDLGYERTFLSWTSDLNLIGENLGSSINATTQRFPIIYESESSSQQIIRPSQNLSATLFSAHICLQISPKGNYLVALSLNRSSIYVLDRRGNIVDTINGNEGFYSSCPVWAMDEKSFYYMGQGIQRYILNTRQTITLYQKSTGQEANLGSLAVLYPLVISPDGNFIAARGGYKTGDYLIAVLYPDGHVRRFGEGLNLDPLWIPPLP